MKKTETTYQLFYMLKYKTTFALQRFTSYLGVKHQHLGWLAQAKYPVLGCNHLEPNMPYYAERDPGVLESGGHDPARTAVESSYKWRIFQTQTHIIY